MSGDNEHVRGLSSGAWLQCERLVQQFEQAHRQGAAPDLEEYLASAGSLRPAVLIELVHTDLELRLKAGEVVRVEAYLARFPELAADPPAVLELVAAEFALRRRREADLNPEEYRRRFPLLGEELAVRLAGKQEAPTIRAAAPLAASGAGCGWPSVPGYEVLGVLGQGGMGQVYKARHRLMNRLAALKVIHQDLQAHPGALRRFRREIEAVAQLAHPNIVRAYHAEQVGDTLVLAMEYCEGHDLGRLLEQGGPLPIGLACDYIRQAALGLQHAFERGLVHRDIKPSNLLVSGTTVKILDFGLALLRPAQPESGRPRTEAGVVMGTPDYLGPEQAIDSHVVDIRADLYSLGCTFYHALVGQVPFPGGSLLEKLLRHRGETPTPLQQLRGDVPPEVAAIVGKLLAKSPTDRYQTPAKLASALAPFARDATPPSQGAPAGGPDPPSELPQVTVCAPAFVPARAPSPRTPAADSVPVPRRRLRWALPLAGASGAVVLALLFAFFSDRNPLGAPSGKQLPSTPRNWQPGSPLPREIPTEVLALAFSPTGTLLAIGTGHMAASRQGLGGDVILWDLAQGREADILDQQSDPIRCLGFSANGRLLAWGIGNWDRDVKGEVKVWDLAESKRLTVFEAHAPGVYCLAFHPGSKFLATSGREPTIRIWDPRTGRRLADLADGHRAHVNSLAFSHDGAWLASGSYDGTVVLWQVDGWKKLGQMGGGTDHWISCVAFSPDDSTLVAGTGVPRNKEAEVRLWDARTRELLRRPIVHGGSHVFSLAIAPDGKTFTTGSQDGVARVWETTTGKQVCSLEHGGPVWVTAYSPDGQTLATGGGWEKCIRQWVGK